MPETVVEPADSSSGQFYIHSFIVRMWLEEGDEGAHNDIWRGRITHIPGDEQKYFEDLDEISIFIRSHLNEQSEPDTH